jgi:coronin-1B/1C/6
MPKRGVNAHENEVTRAFKTINDTLIEPISFIVPRRSEMFQGDIYPPTTGLTPAMGPSEWLSGKEAIPPKVSMASLYEGEGLKEVKGVEDKPTESLGAPQPQPQTEPEPKPKPEPKPAQPPQEKAPEPEPAPEPTPVARPPPSMKEQGSSMAAIASKFDDKEEEEPEPADDSSFEEIPKPVERPTRPTGVESPVSKPSPWQQEERAPKPGPSIQVSLPFNPTQDLLTTESDTPQRSSLSRLLDPGRHDTHGGRRPGDIRGRSAVRGRNAARGRDDQDPDHGADQDDFVAGRADADADGGDRVAEG